MSGGVRWTAHTYRHIAVSAQLYADCIQSASMHEEAPVKPNGEACWEITVFYSLDLTGL